MSTAARALALLAQIEGRAEKGDAARDALRRLAEVAVGHADHLDGGVLVISARLLEQAAEAFDDEDLRAAAATLQARETGRQATTSTP